MSNTSHSRVFSLATILLALLETMAGVPHRQVAKREIVYLLSFFLSFFLSSTRLVATIMDEAISYNYLNKKVVFSLGYCTHSIAFSMNRISSTVFTSTRTLE